MFDRNRPNPDVTVEDITPDVAERYLGKNTHNRPIRHRTVSTYAADMTAGHWRWNGEGIKFAVDGTLLDGQHRLLAIVESGCTVTMPVFRGLPQETQETIDGGIKRKFSDVLALRGESSAIALAAVVRGVRRWEDGARRSIVGGGGARPYSNAELLQTLHDHPELRDVAKHATHDAARCDLPGSVVGLCRWLFDDIDPVDADYFFARLTDGADHQNGEPIYVLRRTLSGTREVRGERNNDFLIAVTIKAWNVYREKGNTPGVVGANYRFSPGGARPEKMPEPK